MKCDDNNNNQKINGKLEHGISLEFAYAVGVEEQLVMYEEN